MALVKHLPNIMSLSRIIFLFVTTSMFFIEFKYHYTVAFWSMFIASISDVLDGKIARHYKVVSKFGIFFDAIADKIMTIGVFITFIAKNIYPAYYVFPIQIILCREFLISGLRMLAAK